MFSFYFEFCQWLTVNFEYLTLGCEHSIIFILHAVIKKRNDRQFSLTTAATTVNEGKHENHTWAI